ncbi:MAG: HIT family protein [Rhodocyclales bacterium]|nr:HIT family protein [Rhodocyclales bacterium]
MNDCVFCRIVRGDLPAARVYEDEATLAFMDLQSVNPGHLLVTLKQHHADIYTLDDAAAGAAFRTVARMARTLKRELGCDGVTVLQANEVAGGQTVFHFHAHVVPRWKDDGAGLIWPVKNPPREALDEMAARLRKAIAC